MGMDSKAWCSIWRPATSVLVNLFSVVDSSYCQDSGESFKFFAAASTKQALGLLFN